MFRAIPSPIVLPAPSTATCVLDVIGSLLAREAQVARTMRGARPRRTVAAMSKLGIYLNDHYAAATGAVQLARRAAASNRETQYGHALADLATEIEEDRQALKLLMQRLGVRSDPAKAAVAWSAEKLGRLKLNGQLSGYSPLSRLEELEILSLGVEGKLAVWQALQQAVDHGIAEAELETLIKRARAQRRRLERYRLQAAVEALGAPDNDT